MTVELDRIQREAVREEVSVTASAFTDMGLYFDDRRDRASVLRLREQLDRAITLMDAIGWQEQDDAPDRQAVVTTEQLREWCRSEADEIEVSLGEIVPEDRHLDALRAFRELAGAVGGDA
jgi:hypothetical protein